MSTQIHLTKVFHALTVCTLGEQGTGRWCSRGTDTWRRAGFFKILRLHPEQDLYLAFAGGQRVPNVDKEGGCAEPKLLTAQSGFNPPDWL